MSLTLVLFTVHTEKVLSNNCHSLRAETAMIHKDKK